MNKLKLIGFNLVLVLGISASLGFAYSDQSNTQSTSSGSVVNSSGSQSRTADSSVDKISNNASITKDSCTINAAGGCAGCGACTGQCSAR